MNKIELEKVPKDKVGRIEKNGIKLEDHEEKTIRFLLKYGFNIELIRPVSIPKMNNPDILVSGAIWEIKAPTSFNENKLKKRKQFNWTFKNGSSVHSKDLTIVYTPTRSNDFKVGFSVTKKVGKAQRFYVQPLK